MSALEIFNKQPALQTIYLIREDLRDAACVPTEERAALFLLWAAVYGRKEYHGIVIDADYLEFIRGDTGFYSTRLEMFAAFTAGKARLKPDEIHEWFDAEGISEFNMELFCSPRPYHKSPVGSLKESSHSLVPVSLSISRSREPAPATADPYSGPGANLIGFADETLGIGEDVRALARVLRHADVPLAIYNVALSSKYQKSEQYDLSTFFVDRPVFSVNIFCVTPFETERQHSVAGSNLFSKRYNIGYWPWELNKLPSYWLHAFDEVDEIWAISDFLVDVYSQYTEKPVIHMPPYVNIDTVIPFERASLSIDVDKFIFLTVFDFNSFLTRKNTVGVIRAFKTAFPQSSPDERLIIKTINGGLHPDRFEELVAMVKTDPRIVLMDGPMSRAATLGLIAAADCVVSLHRAEGFGRVIAESMFLGTPVVATDYSGSRSLLDDTVGFPVGYRLVDVRSGEYPFHEGSQWAEPDFDHAVAQLQTVRKAGSEVVSKISNAKIKIEGTYSLDAVAARVRARLHAVERTTGAPSSSSHVAADHRQPAVIGRS